MTSNPTTNSSPADRLRKAARLMRERAGKATPGPWESLNDGDRLVAWKLSPDGQFDDDFEYVVDDPISNAANAGYIASMHPAVALALADWLYMHVADLTRAGGLIGACDSPADTTKALAIADAYLGEAVTHA